MRFATYNLFNYGAGRDLEDRQREAQVRAVIEDLDADVVAVQELATTASLAEGQLVELAEAVGMTAFYEPPWATEEDAYLGKAAVACGGHGLHVGLMWRPENAQPVPGTLRAYGRDDFWHALVKVVLLVDGGDGARHPVQFCSFHATPFGKHARADQAERVVSALTGLADHPPGIIGADWNCISADRKPDGTYYDDDWHAGEPWGDALVYQCRPITDQAGRMWPQVDREPGEVLYAGGLYDAAAALDAPWEPTTGHLDAVDPFPPRRVDGVRVTRKVVPALQAIETVRTPLTLRGVSDHLPVVITFAPERLG